MTQILNTIIAIGGTTAHQTPKTVATVRQDYIDGSEVLAAVVAEASGKVIGWQSVGHWQDEAHIGTFVQPGTQARGVGAGMFTLTCDLLRPRGITAIIASIRADNVPGLAYYARMGFVDRQVEPDYALNDGRIVGRVHRRYDLV